MSTHRIECTVNGEAQALELPARRLLSDFLRDDLHLTGTKRGCETGVCGACSAQTETSALGWVSRKPGPSMRSRA